MQAPLSHNVLSGDPYAFRLWEEGNSPQAGFNPSLCTPLGVPIAVSSLKLSAIIFANIGDCSFVRRYRERPTSLSRHSPNVRTCTLEMRRHNGFDDIARFKAVLRMFFLGISTRKPVPIHQAHLPRAVPICCN